MKTYKEVFSELKTANRAALIPFFVIGDPDFDTSLDVVKAAIDAGADVLELGIVGINIVDIIGGHKIRLVAFAKFDQLKSKVEQAEAEAEAIAELRSR